MSPLFKVGSIIMLAVMQAAFALEVGNLKMQACRNPIGIDVATPYFGWILASDERGVVQESYEIRVATVISRMSYGSRARSVRVSPSTS